MNFAQNGEWKTELLFGMNCFNEYIDFEKITQWNQSEFFIMTDLQAHIRLLKFVENILKMNKTWIHHRDYERCEQNYDGHPELDCKVNMAGERFQKQDGCAKQSGNHWIGVDIAYSMTVHQNVFPQNVHKQFGSHSKRSQYDSGLFCFP